MFRSCFTHKICSVYNACDYKTPTHLGIIAYCKGQKLIKARQKHIIRTGNYHVKWFGIVAVDGALLDTKGDRIYKLLAIDFPTATLRLYNSNLTNGHFTDLPDTLNFTDYNLTRVLVLRGVIAHLLVTETETFKMTIPLFPIWTSKIYKEHCQS